MDSKPGTNKLATVMVQRMRKENATSPVVDFGEIKKQGRLVTDQFPLPIDKGDYMVLSNVSAGKLSEGDRVLVLWVENEAVVVDVVEDS